MHHATGCHLVDGVFHPKTLVLRSVHFRFSLPAYASTSSRINELLETSPPALLDEFLIDIPIGQQPAIER
jgi:hypothetical protein